MGRRRRPPELAVSVRTDRLRRRGAALVLVVAMATGCTSPGSSGDAGAASSTPNEGVAQDETSGPGALAPDGSASAAPASRSVDEVARDVRAVAEPLPEGVLLERLEGCDELLELVTARAAPAVTPYGLLGMEAELVEESIDEHTGEASVGDVGRVPLRDPALRYGHELDGADALGSAVVADEDLVVAAGRLGTQLLDVSGGAPTLLDQVPASWPSNQLQLTDGMLVVSGPLRSTPPPPPRRDGGFAPVVLSDGGSGVRLYDLSPDGFALRGSVEVDGVLRSLQLVDGRLHVVTTSLPQGLELVLPSEPGLRGEAAALQANRAAVAGATAQDWLPRLRLTDARGAVSEGPAVACDHVVRPSTPAGFSTTTVVSLDVEELFAGTAAVPADGLAILSSGVRGHAGPEHLHLTTSSDTPTLTPGLVQEPTPPDADALRTAETVVHRVRLGDAGPVLTGGAVIAASSQDRLVVSPVDREVQVAATQPVPVDGAPTARAARLAVTDDDGLTVRVESVVVEDLPVGPAWFVADRLVLTAAAFGSAPSLVVDMDGPDGPTLEAEWEPVVRPDVLHELADGRLLVTGHWSPAVDQLGASGVGLYDPTTAAPSPIVELRLPSEDRIDHVPSPATSDAMLAADRLAVGRSSDQPLWMGGLLLDLSGSEAREVTEIVNASSAENVNSATWGFAVVGDLLVSAGGFRVTTLDLATGEPLGFVETEAR